MKHIQIKSVIVSALFILLAPGCNKILEETPRSIYTPEFFKTEKGVLGGITSQYAHLRFIYGQPYYYNSLETGTDEYTYGQSGDGNQKDIDLSGVGNLTGTTAALMYYGVLPFQIFILQVGLLKMRHRLVYRMR